MERFNQTDCMNELHDENLILQLTPTNSMFNKDFYPYSTNMLPSKYLAKKN